MAELIKRHATSDSHRSLASSFAVEDESRDWPILAPTQVESIATLHTVRKGKKRHHVLLASGGVLVSPETTLVSTAVEYPSLDAKQSIDGGRPVAIDRWWWDVDAAKR